MALELIDLSALTARLDGKVAYEEQWGLDNEALMSVPLSVSQVRALINELRAARKVVAAAREVLDQSGFNDVHVTETYGPHAEDFPAAYTVLSVCLDALNRE